MGESMKKIRIGLFILVAFLGMLGSLNIVQAAGLGHGPNTGDYVYENEQYITNNQYDKLTYINDTNDSGPSPQKLYLIIFQNKADLAKLNESVSGNDFNKNTSLNNSIVQHAGQALYGPQGYYELDHGVGSGDADDKNNYLIYDIKNGRVFFDPSDAGSLYITDLMFLRMRLGINHQLKHGTEDEKMTALFQLADKLAPKMHDVSQTKGFLQSTDSGIIQKYASITMLIAGILIFGMFIWFAINDQDPPGSGSSDYDAGFDEGNYYGSRYGNDRNDNNDGDGDY